MHSVTAGVQHNWRHWDMGGWPEVKACRGVFLSVYTGKAVDPV